MKTLISEHPRFVCRAVRGWISVFGDATAGAAGGFGSRHVETCEACQRFFAASHDLDLSLRRAAAGRTRDIPAGLDQRIIHAVNSSPRALHRLAGPSVWLMVAGAAASVALAVFLLPRQPAAQKPEAIASTQTEEPINAAYAPRHIWNSLMTGSDALVEQNPVQDEVDAVYSDTKSALRFLSMNFIPSDPQKSADEEGENSGA